MPSYTLQLGDKLALKSFYFRDLHTAFPGCFSISMFYY